MIYIDIVMGSFAEATPLAAAASEPVAQAAIPLLAGGASVMSRPII